MGLQLIPAELILEQELPAAQTIYQLGLSNRLQLRQMANITVQSTIRRYQKATTKIQKKILAIGNSSEARVGRLSGLLGEIEKEIRILNEGIIRDIESTAERALRESVRQAAQNAGPFAQAVRGPLAGASPTSMQGQFNILVNQVEKAFRAVPKGIQLSDRIWNTHSITLIKMRNLRATGVVTGECSSATLWPFAACHRRFVTPFSVLLFHPMRWQSEENVGLAEAAEWARHFGHLEQEMDNLLAELFGISIDDMNQWINPGRYFTGRELAEAGLVELVELDQLPSFLRNGAPMRRSAGKVRAAPG